MILETLQSHVFIKELHNRLADPFANPMIHLETKGTHAITRNRIGPPYDWMKH